VLRFSSKFDWNHLQQRRQMLVGYDKIGEFRAISRYISEMVQDGHSYWKMLIWTLQALSNVAIFNDHEWHLTTPNHSIFYILHIIFVMRLKNLAYTLSDHIASPSLRMTKSPLKGAWSWSNDPFIFLGRNHISGTHEARVVKFCKQVAISRHYLYGDKLLLTRVARVTLRIFLILGPQ